MNVPAPALETLLRRLADTPRDFLDAPRLGKAGAVHVDALVFDLSYAIGEPCTHAELADGLAGSAGRPEDANWLTLAAIGCWLLADEALRGHLYKAALLTCITQTLRELAREYAAERYILDPERREEMVRIVLADLQLRPAGETEAQAQDRLQALSSVERRRIIREAREAEKRAREIREALIKKAAAEAADKYTRE
jgi:hypothetical protein